MTRGTAARAQRRMEPRESLPPALRAELRGRVADAASRRDRVLDEARRQKRVTEQAAAEAYERIRAAAQDTFERERAAIRDELERRVGGDGSV